MKNVNIVANHTTCANASVNTPSVNVVVRMCLIVRSTLVPLADNYHLALYKKHHPRVNTHVCVLLLHLLNLNGMLPEDYRLLRDKNHHPRVKNHVCVLLLHPKKLLYLKGMLPEDFRLVRDKNHHPRVQNHVCVLLLHTQTLLYLNRRKHVIAVQNIEAQLFNLHVLLPPVNLQH